MSFCTRPMVAATNAVVAPRKVMKAVASGAYSIKGDMRQIRNTPAVTIVAAWIRADTGVGPSIASGNQVCRNNCADLPIAPTNNRKASKLAAFHSVHKKLMLVSASAGAAAKMSLKLMLSVMKNRPAIPKAKPK